MRVEIRSQTLVHQCAGKNKVGKERRLKGLMKSRETLETDLLRLTGNAWWGALRLTWNAHWIVVACMEWAKIRLCTSRYMTLEAIDGGEPTSMSRSAAHEVEVFKTCH